jgi:two-component system sensor histidine kinase YesM
MRKSLRFKFIVGFLMIITPLIVFLIFNNLYAMNVVREEVSKTNNNLLAQHVKQTDKLFTETNNYLFGLRDNENDINELILSKNTDDYVIIKQRILSRFQTNLNYFQLMDSIFLYNYEANDLIFSTKQQYYDIEAAIKESIPSKLSSLEDSENPQWKMIRLGDKSALIKLTRLSSTMVAGALVSTDTLLNSLKFLDAGNPGGSVILTKAGDVASTTTLSASKLDVAIAATPKLTTKYQTVSDPVDGAKYLLIGSPSEIANINYIVMIPEGNMLQHLPFFQLAVYIIPLGGLLFLAFYLILLRQVLLKPMKAMMYGMNRIIRGDLNVQLNVNHSSEFAFLMGTFNNMVLEISRLKIDVYEEKIHTQEAEFGLLQVQIRPHFYLNSLNIIHSLASIKEYQLIQKMTQHLAEYFRFITHTKRKNVTLEAEIKHVENYLEIQKLRFPNQLVYEIALPDHYRHCIILPLAIQTFIENTIIHGFAERSQLFKIHIQVVPDELEPEDYLWIIVSDNGVGFSEEVLLKLQEGTYANEVFEEGHVGIQNVMQRQQIRYEGKAKLLFNNLEGKGAEIRIGIPFMIDVNEEDDDV